MFERNTKKAFTLAEVLVTLAVIGIVASMTIPAIISNYEESNYRSTAKNTLASLNQALAMMKANQNIPDFSASAGWTPLRDSFLEYMKTIKTGKMNELFYTDDVYKFYKNNSDGRSFSTYNQPSCVTSSGITIAFLNLNTNCTSTLGGSLNSICALIFIDVNGIKPPNMYGKDFLHFSLIKEKDDYRVIPAGSNHDGTGCIANSPSVSSSYGCTARYINGRELP